MLGKMLRVKSRELQEGMEKSLWKLEGLWGDCWEAVHPPRSPCAVQGRAEETALIPSTVGEGSERQWTWETYKAIKGLLQIGFLSY